MTTTFDPIQTPLASMAYQNTNNILDNGGLEVWQRNTSFTFNTASFSTVNVYTADRWSNQAWWGSGSPVWTITRESSTIHDGQYSLKFNMTALGVTLQDQRMVGQVVENYQAYAGKTLIFSAWVNTTSPHVNLRLTDGISTSLSINHPGDGQWHQLSTTLLISASTSGIQTSMSWDAQVNATTGAHYLDSAMLLVGSQVIPFVPTNPQQDLARCQRYYLQVNAFNDSAICVMQCTSTTTAQGKSYFPTQMRIAPTVTTTNGLQSELITATGGGIGLNNLVTGASTRGCQWNATVGGSIVAGNASELVITGVGFVVEFSADL